MTDKFLQTIDKELVARRFAQARDTYDRAANVQRQVAEKMIGLIPAAPYRHLVEIGCGTGIYSRLLCRTFHPETLHLNDLCSEMKECVADLCHTNNGTQVCFEAGDAEQWTFPAHTDLITSCSTLQWFCRPADFFARCHEALEPGGVLTFSTFGSENLREIRQLTGNGLQYIPLHDLQELLSPYFEVLHAEEEIVSLPFDSPLDVLKHLKQTGVSGTEKRMWTRSRLAAFCNEYTRLFADPQQRVSLTYHPIYVVARKKRN